jgi:hypothetical protein
MKLVPWCGGFGEENKRSQHGGGRPGYGGEYAEDAASFGHGLFIEDTADAVSERGDEGEQKIDRHKISFLPDYSVSRINVLSFICGSVGFAADDHKRVLTCERRTPNNVMVFELKREEIPNEKMEM